MSQVPRLGTSCAISSRYIIKAQIQFSYTRKFPDFIEQVNATGQFGFYFNTYQGSLPQQTKWKSTWSREVVNKVKGRNLSANIRESWSWLLHAI